MPTLKVNPAVSTHPVGLVAPADVVDAGDDDSEVPLGAVPEQLSGIIDQIPPGSD